MTSRFPTGEEVYNRLRYDARFDVDRCRIVYAIRPRGTKSVPYRDFEPGGRVPWHRIVEFRLDDRVIWSRPDRIDRLDDAVAAAAPARAFPAAALPTRALTPLVAPPQEDPGGALRVLLWNVLFARFDSEILRSEERWRAILSAIESRAPDIAVLVEVTPPFLEMLLASPLRRAWSISGGAESVTPHGVLILSRLPLLSCASAELSRGRRMVTASIALRGRTLGVAGVHLASDRAAHARERRTRELAAAFGHLAAQAGVDEWILAGDFNSGEDELSALFEKAATTDSWSALHPGDAGLTFDIARNALAATLSSSGRSGRFDRILTLAGTRAPVLRARTARLIGVEPVPGSDRGLFPSDHFGLVVELAGARPEASSATSGRTAAAIVVTERLGAIQRIRARFDSAYPRWMPHLNLLFPFVEAEQLEAAAEAMRGVLSAHPPFDLTLDRVARLKHASGETIALEPGNSEASALRAALARAFPGVSATEGYRPHLTLGRVTDGAESRALLAEAAALLPVTVRVERVSLLARDAESPFAIAHDLPLAGVSPRAAKEPALPAAAAAVEAALEETGATLEVFGSALYAPAIAGRDLDLLIRAPHDRAALVAKLVARFGLRDAGSGGAVTHLRGGGLDLLLVSDEPSAEVERAVRGPADGRALLETIGRHGRREAFDVLLSSVREWTHARAIGSQALGFPGSLAWAVLTAVPLLHDPILCEAEEDMLPAWLAWLDALPPAIAISLTGSSSHDEKGLRVLAPASPHVPLTRTLSAATESILRGEIRRAARLARSARTRSQVAAPLAADPPRGDILTVRGNAAERGVYEARFLSLFRELTPVASVRPWAIEDGFLHRLSIEGDLAIARTIAGSWLTRECPGAKSE